jgi:hypothetical protein
MQLRSFYLGGDAHLYYASREYVFDRPAKLDAAAAASSSASVFGSSATTTVGSISQSMDRAGNTVSSSGVATCAAGGLGSTWLAYENAEFAPWEEMLLDATAWMIAIVLCWDPMRGQRELEECENEREEDHHQQHHHRDVTTGRNRKRRLAGKDQEIDAQDHHHHDDNNDRSKRP